MAHNADLGCGSKASWGVQLGTSPDFRTSSFIPAYACDNFTAQESAPTFAVRVLLKNLTVGQTYYYVCGSEASKDPWSRVYTFTYGSGQVRPGGPVYAVLADFGCVD
jgi:phosphodiesterase/alkaline phosphatase D-like protein